MQKRAPPLQSQQQAIPEAKNSHPEPQGRLQKVTEE
jgi:hypothetical protein